MSHEDKTFLRSFISVLAALVVIAFMFYFIADLVTSDLDSGEDLRQGKIEENIKPVGQVNVGSAAVSSEADQAPTEAAQTAPASAEATETAAAGPRSGEQVYKASCLACHSTGVAGAPKVGDQASWASRAAKGLDGMTAAAISGIKAMPPKGTCMDCTDEELKAAIVYMLSQSGY